VRKLLICLILVLPSFTIAQPSQSKIESDLRAAFVGKNVLLKVPDTANKLHFDAQGKLSRHSEDVPWTTYGLLQPTDVSLSKDRLRIKAVRVIASLQEVNSQPRLLPIATERFVELDVEARGVSFEQLYGTLSRILEGGDLEKRFSSYWKPSVSWDALTSNARPMPIDGIVGRLNGTPVYSVMPALKQNLLVPKPIQTPEPQYPERQRLQRLAGTATVLAIINEHGFPELIGTLSDLPNAFDTESIATVAEWRFRPAMKDGNPVPIFVEVQVRFVPSVRPQ
jgi:TonB family protein